VEPLKEKAVVLPKFLAVEYVLLGKFSSKNAKSGAAKYSLGQNRRKNEF